MTFDELSLMAFHGFSLPQYAKLHEMAAYFGLQNIYRSFEHHFISKEQAEKSKKELYYRFQDEAQNYEASLKSHRDINRIRAALGGQFKTVEKSGCPVCKRLVEILDGKIPLKEGGEFNESGKPSETKRAQRHRQNNDDKNARRWHG